MLIDTNKFRTLSDTIKHFSSLPGVVGIVEYGGRSHTDMRPGGDYDLTVIFDKPVSKNFSGIHFHVAGIPVDCMLLSMDDFNLPQPESEFWLVHLNCNILYDKDGVTKHLLENIKSKWKKPNVSENQKMWIRFATRHTIDKLEHRLFENEIYSRVFIAQTIGYIMERYSELNNLEPGKIKTHLSHMKQNDSHLHRHIESILNTTNLAAQFEHLKSMCAYIAKNLGGMWQENEALFHINPDGINDIIEQQFFINFIFGGDNNDKPTNPTRS